MDYKIGDVVTTKKPHPCGGNKWEIIRTGADYKLKCLTCGRVVMLDGESAKKAIKSLAKDVKND
ncbi:MAG: DUF951 domain-containing protein [Christensenellales bacterium]